MPSFAGQALPSGEFFTSSEVAEIFFLQPLPITRAERQSPSIHTFVFVAFISFTTPNRALAQLAPPRRRPIPLPANHGVSSGVHVHLRTAFCQPEAGAISRPERAIEQILEPFSHDRRSTPGTPT